MDVEAICWTTVAICVLTVLTPFAILALIVPVLLIVKDHFDKLDKKVKDK